MDGQSHPTDLGLGLGIGFTIFSLICVVVMVMWAGQSLAGWGFAGAMIAGMLAIIAIHIG